MARDDELRRVEVGFSGGQAIVAAAHREGLRASCARRSRTAAAGTRSRPPTALVALDLGAGRVREARDRRAPGRLLRACRCRRPRGTLLARSAAARRRSAAALLVAQEPLGLPLQPALLGRGAAPGHHAQAAARDPRARRRASGCSRSARAPATTRSTSPRALDGGTLDDLRHPAGDARSRRCASAQSAGSRTSSRRSATRRRCRTRTTASTPRTW